jgi:hypothetical protein
MTKTGGSIKTKGSAAELKGAKLTAGELHGAKLTGAMLKKTLDKHLHPSFSKDIQGAGLFDKLAGVINMGNIKRLYGAVDKGIKIGTKGYSAYRDIKKGVDGMRQKEEPKMSDEIRQLQEQQMMKGAGLKKKPTKRVLPEALRKRAQRLGELMRQGHSMKEASEIYKKENPK